MEHALAYDIIVIGGGHAGAEAARVCRGGGVRVAMVTMIRDAVAQMTCNPAIGGVAKGQIVREIDALGGEMGKAIDAPASSSACSTAPRARPCLSRGPGRQEALPVHHEAPRRGPAET